MAASARRPLPVVAARGGRQVSPTGLSHWGCRASAFYLKFRGCGELGENPGPWFLVSACGLYRVRWEQVLGGLWYKVVKRCVLRIPTHTPHVGYILCAGTRNKEKWEKSIILYLLWEWQQAWVPSYGQPICWWGEEGCTEVATPHLQSSRSSLYHFSSCLEYNLVWAE